MFSSPTKCFLGPASTPLRATPLGPAAAASACSSPGPSAARWFGYVQHRARTARRADPGPAVPSQSPGRSARLSGSTLRASATASPCVAHILHLLLHRRRCLPTEPRPPRGAASRSRPRAVAPHWRADPAPSHTLRFHWSTPAGAQTGGSTLPFLIGWWWHRPRP